MAQNPFYVYALKDPRAKPAKTFYIGKGTGPRAWKHQMMIDDSEKGLVIQAIIESGLQVIHSVLADDLTEIQALKIEAELISAFGIRSQGGLLTNLVKPNPEKLLLKPKINVPDGCYERAQLGLELMKGAVLELLRANAEGVRNADAAKYLGLQSRYGSGVQDYLTYSILGILMKDGQVSRDTNRRHVALTD